MLGPGVRFNVVMYIVIVVNIQRGILVYFVLFYFIPRREIFVTYLPYLNQPVIF